MIVDCLVTYKLAFLVNWPLNTVEAVRGNESFQLALKFILCNLAIYRELGISEAEVSEGFIAVVGAGCPGGGGARGFLLGARCSEGLEVNGLAFCGYREVDMGFGFRRVLGIFFLNIGFMIFRKNRGRRGGGITPQGRHRMGGYRTWTGRFAIPSCSRQTVIILG